MRLARFGLAGLALAVGLALSHGGLAQRVAQGAVEAWIDGLLAQARQAGASEAKRGAVTYDAATGALSISDVSITSGETTLTIGRISGTNVTAGDRLRADTLTVEAMSARIEGIAKAEVTVDRLAFERLDAPALAPATLLRQGAATALFRDLNAARVTSPSLAARFEVEHGVAYRITLSDHVAEGIARGIARSVRLREQTIVATEPKSGNVTYRLGESTGENFDLTPMVEIMAPAPNTARERRLLAASYRTANASIDMPALGARVEIGPMEARNMFATPPRISYLEFIRLAARMAASGRGQPDPASVAEFLRVAQDWIDLWQIERLDIRSFNLDFGMLGFDLKIGAIEGQNASAMRFGTLAANDVSFGTLSRERGRIARVALADLDFSTIVPLALQMIDADARGGAPDLSKLDGNLPRVGAIEVQGFSQQRAGAAVPLAFERLRFEMGAWRGLVPERLSLALARASSPDLAQIPGPRELGYDRLVYDMDIRVALDEAGRRLRLSPARFSIDDAMAFEAEVTISGIESRLLGYQGLVASDDFVQAAEVERIRLRFENLGLIDRVAASQARARRETPEAARRRGIMEAMPMLQLFLQDPAARASAQDALRSFADTPRALTLVATPRKGQRLMLAELVEILQRRGGPPPLDLLERFDIRLTAND